MTHSRTDTHLSQLVYRDDPAPGPDVTLYDESLPRATVTRRYIWVRSTTHVGGDPFRTLKLRPS